MKRLLKTFAALVLALVGSTAAAHKASDAYLQLARADDGLNLRVDVALRDLDVLLDLDQDGDGRLTWGELRQGWPAIEAAVRAGVRIDGCALQPAGQGLERRSDGAYAVLNLHADCRPAGEPVLRYTLLGEVDPTHRGLLRIDRGAQAPLLRVLDPTGPAAAGAVAADAAAEGPVAFVREGIHHIVTGYDHVLFLLCLLLPAVMRRDVAGRWQPVERLGKALWPVVGIVSAFTLAHSITLALAALGWVALPSWFIEPAIAVTIVLAGLDNLRPIFRGRRVLVTFAFGLVHGFGFAGVLAELNLPTGAFAWALLQFNLGLELGQLGIVLLATALLYALRGHRRYPAWAIGGGSAAAMAVGVLWFVERSTGLALTLG